MELKSVKQLVDESGLKNRDFAAKYHIKLPSLNRWITGTPPDENRLWLLNMVIANGLEEEPRFTYFRRTAKIPWDERSRLKEGCTSGSESLSTGEAYYDEQTAVTWIQHKKTKVEIVESKRTKVIVVTEWVCVDNYTGEDVCYSRLAIPVGSRMESSPATYDSYDAAEKALAKVSKSNPSAEIIWDWM